MTTADRCWSVLAATLLLAGCSAESPSDHGHPHEPAAATSNHGHAHDEGGDREALVYTDYTDRTELFVEFPALVVGEPSTFAAHLTRLADYAPLTSGQLDVILQRGDQTVARFRVNEPARTGIFTPTVVPREAGQFDLVIEVEDGPLRARHQLGAVQVFDSAAAVAVSQPEGEGDIGYLKEQQWTNPFSTALLAPRVLRPSVPAFATVRAPADASAEIRAPADGYLSVDALAQTGVTVEANQPLAQLVPRLGEGTDIGSLQVARQQAQSRTTLARQEVERLTRLFEQGAIAERRLLEAREALDVARSELEAAQSRMAQTENAGARGGIAVRTPVAGEVIEAPARPGAFVRTGDLLYRIAAPDRRWLELQVPEHYAGALPEAQGAWLTRDAETVVLDPEHGARVVQASSTVDPQSRTATAVVEYPTEAGPALVGARFPAGVYVGTGQPAPAVPRSAIIDDGGRPVVYEQTGGEMFVRRPVELGITDGQWVEVLAGLSPGARVVDRGAYYVKLAATGGEEIGHGHAH